MLEQLVIGTLEKCGFRYVMFSDFTKNENAFHGELLLGNVPFTTLYGGRGFTEFLLFSERYHLRTRIECKWQQKPGSVDEKLPYVYLTCVNAVPEDDVIVLIDGAGFRKGSIDWLRQSAADRVYIPPEKANKRIRVMNSTEFLTWCNETFR